MRTKQPNKHQPTNPGCPASGSFLESINANDELSDLQMCPGL